MSSDSTLFIKSPGEIQGSKIYYEKPSYHTGFAFLCLWILAAIITAANTDPNIKVTGVALTFKLQDVLTLVLVTCMIARSFNTGNPYLAIPWIAVSAWNMYYCQYPSILKMAEAVYYSRYISKLAWIALGIDIIGLVTKLLLILRVAHLSVNIWYQNKLQSETLSK